MKALLLYNSHAGRGGIVRHIEKVVEIFRHHDIELKSQEIDFNTNPFDGNEDIDIVVISGGDGTLNYVVNMMHQRGINPQLGIIPSGTANDFAGAIGMPRSILRAAKRIAQGTEHRVDLGKVNGMLFVNVLSFGVLTTTSQQTSEREKQMVGKLAYIRTGAHDLRTMHPIALHVKSDTEEFDIEAVMCLVFNGETAGRIRLAPEAEVNDGMLDVLILEYGNPVTTCINMIRHLIHHNTDAVRHIRCQRVELITDCDERTDVDGQPGPKFPMQVECIPGALRLRY